VILYGTYASVESVLLLKWKATLTDGARNEGRKVLCISDISGKMKLFRGRRCLRARFQASAATDYDCRKDQKDRATNECRAGRIMVE